MDSQLHKIGFISKLNGHSGELVLASDDDTFFEDEFLFIRLDGINVPFAVEEIFEKNGRLVIRLEDVNDTDHAQLLIGKDVLAEQKKKKRQKQSFSARGLTGYHVQDASFGDLGAIVRIDEFPGQEMAVCVVNGREVLIPLNDEFIVSIDRENRILRMDLPEGLISLNQDPEGR